MTEQLLREAQMSFDVAQAEALLAGGDKGGMDQYVDTVLARSSEKMTEAFQPLLFDILAEAGEGEARAFNEDGGFRTADSVGFAFNKSNPEAILWAHHRSMELVKWISEEGRANLRAILSQAWANGIPVAEAARRMRSELMLAPNHAAALDNFRKKLTENEGQLVTQGGLRYRVPKGGMTPEALEKAAARYEARLRRVRAENIARTETVAASNEGQRQLWIQAKQAGHLGAGDKRKWLTTPVGACPLCIPMHGQLRGLSEPFMTPNGRAVMGPPAHPSCRCSQGLALAADQAPAPAPAPTTPALRGWQRVTSRVNWMTRNVAEGAPESQAISESGFVDRMKEAAQAVDEEIERMMAEFKELSVMETKKLKALHLVDTDYWKISGSATTAGEHMVSGLYNPATHELWVQTRLVGRSATGNWTGEWSLSTIRGWKATLRHELGHHLHMSVMDASARSEWLAIYKRFTKRQMSSLVTQYAATNSEELFAEAFAAYTDPVYGFGKGGKLPDAIHKFMEKYVGARVTP